VVPSPQEPGEFAAQGPPQAASSAAPRSLAALQKKHRELTERIRLAAKKERQATRRRQAVLHQKLGSLAAAELQQDPVLAAALLRRAEAAKWSASNRAWLAGLCAPPAEGA
jgi:hypothetical protein